VTPIIKGIGVSPGLAMGKVYLLRDEVLPLQPQALPPTGVEDEIDRFNNAREIAKQEIADLRGRISEALGTHYAAILEAQSLILDDPDLIDKTITLIRDKHFSASWALKQVVDEYMQRFELVEDPYIRERGGELSDVHARLQRLIVRGSSQPMVIPEGPVIVVAPTLLPTDAVALARQGVVGLASDGGGRTSHTAILAQALSVPAVAGLRDASVRVQQGDEVILDGDSGELYLLPTEAETEQASVRRQAWMDRDQRMVDAQDFTSSTLDGERITIRANIEFPGEVQTALRYGAEGIGLYRSEFLFLMHAPDFPTEQEHFETYAEIAEKVAPHTAIIRTLDLGGEKYFHEVVAHEETNPVLGLRAVRLCLHRPDIFRPQLRGLLRAATHANLQIMLPLVTSIEEVDAVRKLMAVEAADLKSNGIAAREDVSLGIMIEVPAAAAIADTLAKVADFFSIGTNDLIQYSLAVDRGNASVDYLYQPFHPGLLRMLAFIVESANSAAIPVSLCGEMAADPRAAALLIGLGLRELSIQPRAMTAIRDQLRTVDSKTARQQAELALGAATAADVEAQFQFTD
jgi:phosphotransferase system enzyme I (PtsI)